MDSTRSLPAKPPTAVKKPFLPPPKASDALPLPLYLTNFIFFTLFFSVAYFLLHRWREKIRTSTPLHIVTLTEISAILSLFASFIYLLGFFGIDFVQSIIYRNIESEEEEEQDDLDLLDSDINPKICPKLMDDSKDEEIIKSVLIGKTPSYSLESKLGDCHRAALIRREAVQRVTKRSLEGLPLDGFDYASILGHYRVAPTCGYLLQYKVGV